MTLQSKQQLSAAGTVASFGFQLHLEKESHFGNQFVCEILHWSPIMQQHHTDKESTTGGFKNSSIQKQLSSVQDSIGMLRIPTRPPSFFSPLPIFGVEEVRYLSD